MRRLRWIPALGAFFAAAIGISACGSGVPGNAVVDMAGNPVTLQAFNHWMYLEVKAVAEENAGTPVIVPTDPPNFTGCIAQVRAQVPSLAKDTDKQLKSACSSDFSSLSSEVMQFLITAYWYQAEASKQHINVTSAQVEKEFVTERNQAYPTTSQFDSFLKQSGQTLQDILFKVRFSLVEQKLLAKYTAKVTSADIAAYYQAHMSSFGSPESRNLRIVLAKSQSQAAAAKSALQHGQSWKVVAKKYSTDSTTKNNGGLLTGVTQGSQDTTLDTAAFSAPVNKLIGPIKTQFGYYVLEVLSIKKATQQTLAQATSTIQQTLNSQAQNTANTKLTALTKRDWLSKTTCRKYYMMNQCKGYKASSSTSSTATAATTS